MLETIQTPALAFEVTMQPLRRFDLDAAIIFADILNPLIGMGVNLDFIAGEGPRIFNPITSDKDVVKIKTPKPEDTVAYTLEAIELVSRELASSNVTLLGFCGAPFTLASYLIEGEGSHSLTKTKQFMYREPNAWNMLLGKLVVFLSDYLVAQINAGTSAVQIFDSWAGYLSPYQYERFVLPHLSELVRLTRARTDAPIVFFSTATFGIMPLLTDIPFNGWSVDWRVPISQYASLIGDQCPIQGNLDPEILAGPVVELERETLRVLEDAKDIPHHIFNLGHGILPHTPPENLSAVISTVRKWKS